MDEQKKQEKGFKGLVDKITNGIKGWLESWKVKDGQPLSTKDKVKKSINLALNVITVLICIFALMIAISAISSSGKGYSVIFGNTYLTVASDSMVGEKWDNFSKGDVIKVDVLSDEQKGDLKVGDVITFWDIINGEKQLNSHRIEDIKTIAGEVRYYTKGDANTARDSGTIGNADIVGKFLGKASGAGKAFLWIQTSTGFLVCVVLPSVLVLIYCLVLVILNVRGYNKNKMFAAKEAAKEEALLEALKLLQEQKEAEAKKDESEVVEKKDEAVITEDGEE